MFHSIICVLLILIVIDLGSSLTMNVAGYNSFTGLLPSEIGLLSGLFGLNLGKLKYFVDPLDLLSISCDANHHLSFLNLIINYFSSLFTLNAAGYNAFFGSLPSEIGLLTRLSALGLGE